FFPEKRPFFVQGSSIFNAGKQGAGDYWGFNWSDPTFFYTRRIGRSIRPDAASGAANASGRTAFADVPAAAQIPGAAKLTGKMAPGFGIGLRQAVTDREFADVQCPDLARGNFEVQPLSYYGVVRGLREFNERRHGLGVLGTLTARRLDRNETRDAFDR